MGYQLIARLVFLALIATMIGSLIVEHAPSRLFLTSPNSDERPPHTRIDCIVLHATATATIVPTLVHFLNPDSKVSAHYVIDRDGTIIQMVPLQRRAWHAGRSVLQGVHKVNDFSIGIEIVNLNDGRDSYSKFQYEAVARLIRELRASYSIPDSRIVSHAQIALPRGRKTDPVHFDLPLLLRIVHH